MTTFELVALEDKIKKTISSCVTLAQLDNAINYTNLCCHKIVKESLTVNHMVMAKVIERSIGFAKGRIQFTEENDNKMAYDINQFIDDDGFSPIPCPNCGGKVEITNIRDCEVLSTYARCTLDDHSCNSSYFSMESNAFTKSPSQLQQSAFDIVAIKYFYWAQTERAKIGYRCKGEWE